MRQLKTTIYLVTEKMELEAALRCTVERWEASFHCNKEQTLQLGTGRCFVRVVKWRDSLSRDRVESLSLGLSELSWP